MDILQRLIAYDEQLVDWLLHTNPTTAAEANEMKRLFALRSRIDGQLNTLVKQRLILSTLDLAEKCDALDALTQQIAAADRQIAKVKQVLELTAAVVALAAAIITLVV